MKRLTAVILAVCALFCFPPLPARAQADKAVIALRLNSSIAGCTRADADKLLEICCDSVEYYDENGYSISIVNRAGGGEYAHMDAGRTYTITYALAASSGYTLPETLADGDVSLTCGKGVSGVSCLIAEAPNADPTAPGEANTTRVLRITAKVIVDGTPLQRVIGWLQDLFLIIRSRLLK